MPHYDPDEHIPSRPEFVAEWRAETARKRAAGLEPEVGDYDYEPPGAYLQEGVVDETLGAVPGLGTALETFGPNALRNFPSLLAGVPWDVAKRQEFGFGFSPDELGSHEPHSPGYQHWLDLQAKYGPGGTYPGGRSNEDLVGRDSGPGNRRRPVGLIGQDLPQARYQLGDEWQPASRSPADVVDIQRQLVEAGLLGAGMSRPGVWDNWSANAYARALGRANVTGEDIDTALADLAEHPVPGPLDTSRLNGFFEEVARGGSPTAPRGPVELDPETGQPL